MVYVVLDSLSRVRFGECLLSEFLQSEHLVGWKVQEVWGILRLKLEYLVGWGVQEVWGILRLRVTVSKKLGTVDTFNQLSTLPLTSKYPGQRG